MTVRKITTRRPNGTTYDRWMIDVAVELPNGLLERVRKVSPIQSKRGAEAYEQEVRAAILYDARHKPAQATPTPPPAAAPTPAPPLFGAFFEEYMTNHAATRCKPSSLAAKRTIYKCHVGPAAEGLRLDQLNKRWADGYQAQALARGLKPRTINTHLALVSRTLHVAFEWGVLSSPPPKMAFLRPGPGRTAFLSADDAHALLSATDGQEVGVMIRVALRTGVRLGELLALRWEDVDWAGATLKIERTQGLRADTTGTPKGGKPRAIPLAPSVVSALKAHRHLKGPWVFCGSKATPYVPNTALKMLRRACAAANIPRVTWHVLRHTFASHLVMTNTPLRVVQELMGHATLEMTMRYSHLTPEVSAVAVARLDRHPARVMAE